MRRGRVFFGILLVSALSTGRAPLAQPQPALTPALLTSLQFRTIGPAHMSGRIVDIAVVEANPSIFYAASATGGLWKTTDNGTTFTRCCSTSRWRRSDASPSASPTPTSIWVGSGEATNRQSSGWGDGVYKSADAGRTWTNVGLKDSHHIGRIVLHPTNPDIVYVAALGHLWGANRERGLFKSIDGGRTWKASLQIDEDTGVSDVAMDPSDPNTLYAAAHQRRRRAYGFHGGGPGNAPLQVDRRRRALEEADERPALRRTGAHRHLDLSQGSARRLRVRRTGAALQRVDRVRTAASAASTDPSDKGETWRLMSDWNPRPTYASQIRVDPNDDRRIYMVSYSYSDNGGETFVSPPQSLHGDDRMLWIDPRDSNHIIKADDGGDRHRPTTAAANGST